MKASRNANVKNGPKLMLPSKVAPRVREIASQIEWKKVTALQYKRCPHEYILYKNYPTRWKQLAKIIAEYGEYRDWRGQQFSYLTVDEYIYWRTWSVINRTFKAALDNGGYPSKPEQKHIYKRFWGGK